MRWIINNKSFLCVGCVRFVNLKPDGGEEPRHDEQGDEGEDEEHEGVASAGLEVDQQGAPALRLQYQGWCNFKISFNLKKYILRVKEAINDYFVRPYVRLSDMTAPIAPRRTCYIREKY